MSKAIKKTLEWITLKVRKVASCLGKGGVVARRGLGAWGRCPHSVPCLGGDYFGVSLLQTFVNLFVDVLDSSL